MAPDLFSFLHNAPPEDDSDNEISEPKLLVDGVKSVLAPPPTLGQMRKSSPVPDVVMSTVLPAPTPIPGQKRKPDNGQFDGELQDIGVPREVIDRPIKRPRPASPAPVVVDEFQTEAKREMAASGGLTGPVEEGSRLELRHQVCTTTLKYPSVLAYTS
jgi:ATP-dependent RNA helicase DOB1